MIRIASQYLASSNIAGDYAEFGVWRGDTFATAYKYISRIPKLSKIKYHAFDSFEGFPDPKGIDIHPIFQKSGRSFDSSSFLKRLRSRKVPDDIIRIYPGWFSDTCKIGSMADTTINDQSVCMAWFDGDLYESARDCLPFIFKKLIPGGLVIFDDWNCFEADPSKGERRAVSEYLANNPECILVPFNTFGWHGVSFIYHRRPSM